MQEKFSNLLKKPRVIILVYISICMIVSFGLGVITHANIVNQKNTPTLVIPKQPIPTLYQYRNNSQTQNIYDQLPAINPVDNKNFVASKNGTKFYPVNCSSASRIKEENKIYFSTEQDAAKQGYEKSTACQ